MDNFGLRRCFLRCMLLCCFANHLSNGKIMTLNDKYLPGTNYNLKSIDLRKDESVSTSPHNLVKRAVNEAPIASKKSQVTPNRIILDKVLLKGTQKANHAFVHWVGKEVSEKVIVLTCQFNISSGARVVVDSQLWRSDDYGSSFNFVDVGKGAKINFFYRFPNNSQRLLFTDVEAKKVYTSINDELDDIKSHDVPIKPDMILPSPYDEDKLLAYSLTSKKLYASHDFGQTWTLLSEKVLRRFYWGTPGYDKPDTVHMEIESLTADKAEYKTCISPKCLGVPSDDDNPGPFLADSLIIHKEYMFVQKTKMDGSESSLMVSYKRQPFEMAYFPGDIKPNDFMLLNLDDDQLFVAAIHKDQVNLYLSDATGHYFVLSFTDVYHIVHPYWLEIDLHEVKGMKWTFIVNKRSTGVVNGARSFISFDKGGNWRPVPVTDELKKECKGKDCHLLLNVQQSLITKSIISSEHAPGIIVSHGTLVFNDVGLTPVSLFTSRDGGWTWKKAPFAGNYHLNILDQGSILTAFHDHLFTQVRYKYFQFSCDEGATWKQDMYDQRGFTVNGVLTEPGILTLIETLFGHEQKNEPWTLMKLNFSQVLREKCTEDDYESWFPQDYNDLTKNNCTMGKRIEYKRRKQNASCHNGEELIPREKTSYKCECTREDYECDFGFTEVGGSCTKSKWYTEGYLPISCKQGETYSKSQGYRKISSDKCVEGKDDKKKYGELNSNCPIIKPHGLSISTHSPNIPAGQEISLYLSQKGGSLIDTKYRWDFGDGSVTKSFQDFDKAKHLKYTFTKSGRFKVNVTASNLKGAVTAIMVLHVQERLSNIEIVTPLSGKTDLSVTMNVTVSSQSRILQEKEKHVHFIWNFGDEDENTRPKLTWENSVTHIYKKKGNYAVTVEAVNSVGSIIQQFAMIIYDDADILLLKLGGPAVLILSNPIIERLVLQRLRYQLADDLGIGLERIATTLPEHTNKAVMLYIYPSTIAMDEGIHSITKRVLHLMNVESFGFNLLGKRSHGGLNINVTSAELYTPDDKKGPNLKGVYIGVPVLMLVVAVCVFLLCYYRRKRRSAQQYSMLHIQDDSDALLDDDDDPPLDLNIEFRGRESFRDDPVLDAGGGGSLVLQDNVENC